MSDLYLNIDPFKVKKQEFYCWQNGDFLEKKNNIKSLSPAIWRDWRWETNKYIKYVSYSQAISLVAR